MPPIDAGSEFEAFYRARSDEARRYAATILARRAGEELEDALQTSWTRAWKAWDQADPQRRDAWFFRIVRNCCLDVHRRHRPTEQLDEVRLPGVDHIDPVVDAVDAKRSLSVLQHLKPALRETLWLREVMELSYAEIAELQDVPIGTVMSRLHAGRKKLARLLKDRL
jgi:RNA polymerase sigma-70 factor (ECF subfamily)